MIENINEFIEKTKKEYEQKDIINKQIRDLKSIFQSQLQDNLLDNLILSIINFEEFQKKNQ